MKKIILIIIIIISLNVKASNSSTIVMDVDSGRILYQNNAYEKKLIASTTKIMTFVVAYEYAKDFLDVYVETGDEILKMYGTSIYLSYHEKMTLRDLLYGMMLRSGNDAAEVIAYFVGGSEEGFVKLMNKKASFLGMNNTVFNNPHGLDEVTKNYSTAYDMAILSSYASKIDFYNEVTSTKYYQVKTDKKSYSWTNRNKMVFTYPFFRSGKTGYTPSAGRCLVSSAMKDNLHLTIVSLNDYNYYDNHRILYEEMFKEYKNELLLAKEEFQKKHPEYYIKEDIVYPLKNNEKDKVNIKALLSDNLNELVFSLNNKDIIHEKVYSKEKKEGIEQKNFFQKMKEILKKMF